MRLKNWPHKKIWENYSVKDEKIVMKKKIKAVLRQSFSMCVYCMLLRFQSNYTGLSQPIGKYFANACSKRTLKTTVATQLNCWSLNLIQNSQSSKILFCLMKIICYVVLYSKTNLFIYLFYLTDFGFSLTLILISCWWPDF